MVLEVSTVKMEVREQEADIKLKSFITEKSIKKMEKLSILKKLTANST